MYSESIILEAALTLGPNRRTAYALKTGAFRALF